MRFLQAESLRPVVFLLWSSSFAHGHGSCTKCHKAQSAWLGFLAVIPTPVFPPQTETPCFALRLQSQTLPAGWRVVLLVLEGVMGVKALKTKLFQEPRGFIS